jgi:hypothetical protein
MEIQNSNIQPGTILVATSKCKMTDDQENALVLGQAYEVQDVVMGDGPESGIQITSRRGAHYFSTAPSAPDYWGNFFRIA